MFESLSSGALGGWIILFMFLYGIIKLFSIKESEKEVEGEAVEQPEYNYTDWSDDDQWIG